MQLRIAVVNLQSGIGATKGYRQYFTSGWKYVLPHSSKPLRKAGAFLKEKEIDLVLATEIEAKGLRSGFRSHTDLIKLESDLAHSEFFPTRTIDPMVREGNSILSRYKIISRKQHKLAANVVPRALGEIVIEIDGRTITVFVAHLALRDSLRHTQIQEVANIIRDTRGPIILGGDFNERTQTAFEILHQTGLKHFCALPNFPSWNPKHALQVAFLSDHFEVNNHYVPLDAQFSDHLPLIVEATLV